MASTVSGRWRRASRVSTAPENSRSAIDAQTTTWRADSRVTGGTDPSRIGATTGPSDQSRVAQSPAAAVPAANKNAQSHRRGKNLRNGRNSRQGSAAGARFRHIRSQPILRHLCWPHGARTGRLQGRPHHRPSSNGDAKSPQRHRHRHPGQKQMELERRNVILDLPRNVAAPQQQRLEGAPPVAAGDRPSSPNSPRPAWPGRSSGDPAVRASVRRASPARRPIRPRPPPGVDRPPRPPATPRRK